MEPIDIYIVSQDNYFYKQINIYYGEITYNADNKFTESPKKIKGIKKKLKLDSEFVYYFVKELAMSNFYRYCFITILQELNIYPRYIILQSTRTDLIDYRWNEHVYFLVRERCELDHALSWLSTLGGAFSALGDYFERCADTAGKISMHQLKLAIRLGDPNIASRCCLYLSLSLIQKKKFKTASQVIRNEYAAIKNNIILDERLIRMCQGIWSKLQYEHELYRMHAKIKR